MSETIKVTLMPNPRPIQMKVIEGARKINMDIGFTKPLSPGLYTVYHVDTVEPLDTQGEDGEFWFVLKE